MTHDSQPVTHDSRLAKYRQAAFVYLHVAVLYEAALYVMWRMGMFPTRFGPSLLWLLLSMALAGAVFVGLLRWRNAWLARAVWLLWALRLPGLIKRAFFEAAAPAPPAFYLAAILLAVVNLWFLARAGWDL